jgi:hypothetical protein
VLGWLLKTNHTTFPEEVVMAVFFSDKNLNVPNEPLTLFLKKERQSRTKYLPSFSFSNFYELISLNRIKLSVP